MNKKDIMIIAGGTAGHVFPAIELAKEYILRGEKIIFITDIRMHNLVLKKFSSSPLVEVFYFKGRGFNKNHLFFNIKSMILLLICIKQAFLKILFNRPKVVFGFGGYITVPPIIICKIFKVPIILHEGNKVIGKANRFLIKKANKFTFFFNDIEGINKNKDFIKIGMPIRKEIEFLNSKKFDISENEPIKILITGGSLGAEVMAVNIAKAISNFSIDLINNIKVIQQVRPENLDYVNNLYKLAKIDCKLHTFIENFAEALDWSHLVICRCGSGTLSENLISGRPSIMLPLKSSADNHQMKNALYIQNIGAGWIIDDNELENISLLVDKLKKLIFNKNQLIKASKKAKENIEIGASKRLADLGSNIIT